MSPPDERSLPGGRRGGLSPSRYVPVLVVVLLMLVFILENLKQVEVRLLGTALKVNTRLATALIIAAALGFAAGFLFHRAVRNR